MTQKEEDVLKRLAELLTKTDEKKQERIVIMAEDAALFYATERNMERRRYDEQ